MIFLCVGKKKTFWIYQESEGKNNLKCKMFIARLLEYLFSGKHRCRRVSGNRFHAVGQTARATIKAVLLWVCDNFSPMHGIITQGCLQSIHPRTIHPLDYLLQDNSASRTIHHWVIHFRIIHPRISHPWIIHHHYNSPFRTIHPRDFYPRIIHPGLFIPLDYPPPDYSLKDNSPSRTIHPLIIHPRIFQSVLFTPPLPPRIIRARLFTPQIIHTRIIHPPYYLPEAEPWFVSTSLKQN